MTQILFDYKVNGQHFRCIRKNNRLQSNVVFQIKQSDSFRTMGRGYRFHNTECLYSSSYLNWMNQFHCGGWTIPDDYLYNAVQTGNKLYAGLSFYVGNDNKNKQISENDREIIDTIQASLPIDCIFGEEDIKNPAFSPFYICKCGAIVDYIDLHAVYEAYRTLEIQISQYDQKRIEELCSSPMHSFSTTEIMNYTNPIDLPEIIATGLLLGYPLEATASFINCGL